MTSKDDQIRARLSRLVSRSKEGSVEPEAELETALPVVAPIQHGRGPQKAPTKVQISIRLDRDIVETLRATGRGWQSRINDWLRHRLSEDDSTPENSLGDPEQHHGADNGDHQRAPER